MNEFSYARKVPSHVETVSSILPDLLRMAAGDAKGKGSQHVDPKAALEGALGGMGVQHMGVQHNPGQSPTQAESLPANTKNSAHVN